MSKVYGYTSIDISAFGGLNTLLDPTNLPIFMSPDTRNIDFIPGLARTRSGITSQFSILTGTPSVNYLKTYITQLLAARLLVLDSLGNLYKEDPFGSLIFVAQIENPGAYCNSVSLFSKEYMAFGDNLFGLSIPRQYDDTNFDRVSQEGPGAPPVVTDFLPPAATIASSAAPASASIVTVTTGGFATYSYVYDDGTGPATYFVNYYSISIVDTGTPHGLSSGVSVFVSGVSDADFDTGGTSAPVTVIDATHFSYPNPLIAPATGTGGTYTVLAASVIRSGNVLTIETSAPHGFQIGWQVQIVGVTEVPVGGGIVTITRASSLVTVVMTSAHNLPVGSLIDVEGVTDATFDGQFTVGSVPNSTTFTYTQEAADSSDTTGAVSSIVDGTYGITSIPDDSSFTVNDIGNDFQQAPTGATATIVGSVVAGIHQVSVSFVTREGYTTRPSPPAFFSAGGGKLVQINQLPIGPSNVVARLLMFAPLLAPGATLGSFYSIFPNFQILDNTTTSAIVDFSDTNLIQGTLQDPLFNLELLGEAAGVTEYNDRLFWWGVRDNLQNFNNLTFDGGFGGRVGGFPGTYPLGWTLDPANGAGGQEGVFGVFGESWQIFGDGITIFRGVILQNAFQDTFGARRLLENTSYSVRLRILRSPGMVAGNVNIDVTSADGTISYGIFSVPVASIGTVYQEYIGLLMAPQSVIPQDAVIRLYAGGTPTNAGYYDIDNVEIFVTDSPYLTTDVVSSQAELPENYSDDGLISVAPENGQSIRNVFRIRNYLYIAKESSLYVTADTGTSEPSDWDVNEVSPKVGTPSPRGIALGDEWAIIASRAGAYYFTGQQISDSNKLSNEIQPTWDRINWQYGQTIITQVDTTRKRIYIAVPLDSATIPNVMLTLDYVEGFGDPLGAEGVGRKWNIWDIPANSLAFVVRSDGSEPLFIGNNTNTGKIYGLDPWSAAGTFSDDGSAINSYWQPGFFQQNQRLNFAYVLANITGNGLCSLMLKAGNQNYMKQIRGWYLNPAGIFNMERQIQIQNSRASIVLGTNLAGSYFSLQGLSMFVQASVWAGLRGLNSPS